MTDRIGVGRIALILMVLSGLILSATTHQDAWHRLQSCPSDHNTYVCGDRGRCNRCPDHAFRLAWRTCLCSSSDPTGCYSGC
jgi:hypothetical protein